MRPCACIRPAGVRVSAVETRLGSTSRGRLTTTYVAPRSLTASQIDALWAFFQGYADYERPPWEQSLQAADEVFLSRDPQGELRACGAVTVYQVPWQGRTYGLFFTGLVAIDPAYRGSGVIQRAGLRSYLRCRLRHPWMPLYWYFAAASVQSYLLMSRNFRDYWPRDGRPWPARERALVEDLTPRIYGAAWDATAGVLRGVIRYDEGAGRDRAITDPDVRFYQACNPDRDQGEALICLASLSWRNWLSILGRQVRRRFGR